MKLLLGGPANAAYLGIQRYANNRVNENWTTGSSDDKAA